MLAQKISISLDAGVMQFVESYLKRHRGKSRSQVVSEALQLLQQQEQEAELAAAYAMSAVTDRELAEEFAQTDQDGLTHEAW
jgi:antitoxin ParD1/3/4